LTDGRAGSSAPGSRDVEAATTLRTFLVRCLAIGLNQRDCIGYREREFRLEGRVFRTLAAILVGGLGYHASNRDRGGSRNRSSIKYDDASGHSGVIEELRRDARRAGAD